MDVNFIKELLPLPVLQLSAILTYRSARLRPLVFAVGEMAADAIARVAKLAEMIVGFRRWPTNFFADDSTPWLNQL